MEPARPSKRLAEHDLAACHAAVPRHPAGSAKRRRADEEPSSWLEGVQEEAVAGEACAAELQGVCVEGWSTADTLPYDESPGDEQVLEDKACVPELQDVCVGGGSTADTLLYDEALDGAAPSDEQVLENEVATIPTTPSPAHAPSELTDGESHDDGDNGVAAYDGLSDAELQEKLLLHHLIGLLSSTDASSADAEEVRVRGIVERFVPKCGFGLVAPVDEDLRSGGTYLAHWTQIQSDDVWPVLTIGMEVEFSPSVDDSGKRVAKSITGPQGASISAQDVAERIISPFRVTGKVGWFNKGGYGFILSNHDIDWPVAILAGGKIYVSREELVMAEGSVCALAAGMEVEFAVYSPPGHAIAAADVTAPGGAPLVNPGGATAPVGVPAGCTRPRMYGVKCKFFLSGYCNKGESCSFDHVREDGLVEEATTASGAVCKFYQAGRCRNGASCKYLHDGVAAPGSHSPVVCKFYAQGRCARGATCTFSHPAVGPEMQFQVNPALRFYD